MSILPRLRYILEVCHPSVLVVHDILDVLTRISQHSTQAANEVLRCPRLVETIFTNFLPLSWKMSEPDSDAVYGVPVSAAMRLVRTVCCAGRHMAATLVSSVLLLFIYYMVEPAYKLVNPFFPELIVTLNQCCEETTSIVTPC